MTQEQEHDCEICADFPYHKVTKAGGQCACGRWVCDDHSTRCESCSELICEGCVKIFPKRPGDPVRIAYCPKCYAEK
jgi:hypothetical protein